MALRTSETDELNPARNPGDLKAQEQFGGTVGGSEFDQIEAYANDKKNATPEQANTSKNIEDTQKAESESPNRLNYTGSNKQKVNGKVTTKRKKGPIALIVAIFLGGAVGIGGIFGGPGLLIVNLAEVMTGKFNTQLGSMETRTGRILHGKINGTTDGLCSGGVSIRCKYASLSDKQVEKFKKAGIDIDEKGKTVIRGRTKPATFNYTDNKGVKISVDAKNFTKVYASDPAFRSSVKQAYNPKFAGFADATFRKAAAKLKISKQAPFKTSDDTAEKKTKAIQEMTKNGASDTTLKRPTQGPDGKWTDSNGNAISDTTAANQNASIDKTSAIGTQAAGIEKSGIKAGVSSALKGGVSAVSITGIASDVCTGIGVLNAAASGAKIIRAAQMARYAMVFLTTASMIKAGTAQEKDVSYLGDVITKTTKDNSKSATDSYGYQYAAGTVTGPIDAPASEYLSGGGLGGEFAAAAATLLTFGGMGNMKQTKKTCGIVNNIFVQGAAFIAGIALMLIPGGAAVTGAKIAGQIALSAALVATVIIVPKMLANMAAGVLVDANTAGEDAGNAITAGSGHMMGTVASTGGNAPLTPDQAVAYQTTQTSALALNAAEDSQTYNPLDPYSTNTFMGALVAKLMPYSSNLASVGGVLSSSSSIVGSTFSNLVTPQTKAASASDYTQCQDWDYRDINLATDAFCNPVYGIPPQYLQDDPNVINDRLLATGDIDETTGSPSSTEYSNFVKDCINRTRPLGDQGTNMDEDPGTKCFITDQKTADYYVHYIDQRILTGMEEGYEGGDKATETSNPATPTAPVGDGAATGTFTWPIGAVGQPRGISRCYFGSDFSSGHFGIDIAVPEGSEVLAADGGTVAWTTSDANNFGNAVTIQHENGVFTNYYHNTQVLVSVGDKVSKGQKIALSGNTGNSFGAHLHFEVSRQSSPYYPDPGNTMDPLGYIKIPSDWVYPDGVGCHS